MDAYHNYRGANGCNSGLKRCNQDLEVFSGFHFHMEKGLQIIEGQYSIHIINDSIDTDTRACGICWFKWRQAKNVTNFNDECINVNTLISDEFQTLEKRNSDTSRNCTYIFSVRLMLKERTHKGTHIFVLLEVFNNFMNHGVFFRLEVSNDFTQFCVIGQVVQGNLDDLVSWENFHKFFHIIPNAVGYCIREKTFFQISLFLAYMDYDLQ